MSNDNKNPETNPGANDSVVLTKEQYTALLKRLEKVEKKSAPAKVAAPAEYAISENEKRMQEKVEVRLFKDGGKYKDDVFVSVNGKGYQIKRGVAVKVPRFVKEVLDSTEAQDTYAAQYSERLAAEYENNPQ